MKKIIEKHENLVCYLLIAIYVVVNSYCMQNFGLTDYRSAIINMVFSIVLVVLIISSKRVSYYGLTGVTNLKGYLYFIPLLLIVSVNLWNGFNINNTSSEIVFHILTMLNVGFIEEIIFRGFLFKMMAKSNVKSAIIVSSITFGIGHIVNLLNGADFIPTLLQICYAMAIGYLFVTIFYKSKSLIPCIVAHCFINASSIFNVEKVNEFIDEVKHINHVFGQFMIGKICDSSIVALLTFIFLIIFDYPYALLIAVIIGCTDLIPYFGPYIGTVPSALLICLVNPVKAITFVLFIIVLQQTDGNLITPRIQKQATGLPSFWVLFAITLFGGLFGLVGLLIGVPCFTIIYELIVEQVNKRLRKKNMPTETEYYTKIDGLETKKVKAKLQE